ncbi:hypothetical protein FKW77_001931 [Venturia effusa]|uniref:C2H2-type domain-containing protein n=1 Tax=Venturia effusa TaxID=50376 RepID=A0A517KZ49_9PEZI|nr:hypothetical protein FKW77_001931 [Venturia effusa]
MLHDCDTCDETFETQQACQQHMQDLGHYISSDTSEVQNKTTNHLAASSSASSSSSDSEFGNLYIFLDSVPIVKDDDVGSLHFSGLSSLNGSSDSKDQGVAIPPSRMPDQTVKELTTIWVSNLDQATQIPMSKKQMKKQRNLEQVEMEMEMEQKKKTKKKGPQSSIKCDTCDRKFVDREAVEQHMAAKRHFRSQTRDETRSRPLVDAASGSKPKKISAKDAVKETGAFAYKSGK